jgi:hypothetical protein
MAVSNPSSGTRNIMNGGRFTTVASGFAVTALGLSLGLPGCAGAATAPAAAVTRAGSAAGAPQYVVLNCMDKDKAQVKPGTIYLACADNGIGLTHLHWTSWTPELASAYGTEWQNDCKPSCAQGHVHNYPVVAVLWGSATVTGHPGERRYTEATLSHTEGRPAVYAPSCNGKVVATYPVTQTLPLGV